MFWTFMEAWKELDSILREASWEMHLHVLYFFFFIMENKVH